MATERWTDEMLDELAQTVEQTAATVEQTAETVEQTTHNVDILVGAVNAFLERDRERSEEINRMNAQFLQYKLENDQRFNVLLEEVRFLIRQLGENR